MLNFSAICPYRWKIGLIICMLHRAYNICWNSFTKEIEFLRDLFGQNGYTGATFENCVKLFIDSKFIPCKKQTQQEGISQFIAIPYFGHPSISSAHKLSFLTCTIMSIYSASLITKIKNFFKLKCPTPKLLKANVVYEFDCLCDINISYIGITKRHLATRIKEHRSEKSAIGQHLQTCHTCDHNNIKYSQFRF